jgi:uncharacterized protein (TIGR03118 family)
MRTKRPVRVRRQANPHRPDIAPALGLRAGMDGPVVVSQTGSNLEIPIMVFFFQSRRRRQAAKQRPHTIRLELERLEDRLAPSAAYQQLNLVGYQPGMARYADPNLNGWGLDHAANGPFCVADTSTGVATFYDSQGNTVAPAVTIPAAAIDPMGAPGSPTGVVYNPTSDFVISENGRSAPARFLFDTLDGLICGWNPSVDPNHAIVMVDNSTEAPFAASYTGLAIAKNSQGHNVLYAADSGSGPTTSNNRIDMFDCSFHSLGSFTDPQVASQYPGNTVFQVENLNNRLFVTFAGFTAPFGGEVDVFDTDGHLLTPNHFAANAAGVGPLDNPWGIVQAPADFGKFSNDLLIGSVEGAGNINAFDPKTGAFLGQLQHTDGAPIAVTGLWDLAFGGGNQTTGQTNELFFTAGFTAEAPAANGLFGIIDTNPITVLNNQDNGVGSLRDAIATAAGDDTVVFDPSLEHQTIALTSGELALTRNLDIEGLGANHLTISGSAASRVFDVSGGATVQIADLAITSGLADHGGGILNEAGASLTLSRVTLSGNQAVGGLGGGAIFNDAGAKLTVDGCSLTNNQATTAVSFDSSTGGGGGGAIFNETGASLSVTDSDLSGNQALTTPGYDNFGGAIYNLGGTATISGCMLADNRVSGGGSGSAVGGSAGGAVANSIGAALTVTDSGFTGNEALSAAGDGYFALAGALANQFGSTAVVSNCLFTGNQAVVGTSGLIANEADGGAIQNYAASTLDITTSAFLRNRAVGGAGGGKGEGGGIEDLFASATVTQCTFVGNQAIGGNNFAGNFDASFNPGVAVGGGFANLAGSNLTMDQCTFTGNQAIGGNGGVASGSRGIGDALDIAGGAGMENEAILLLTRTTFSYNVTRGGSNGVDTSSGPFAVHGDAEGGGLTNYHLKDPSLVNLAMVSDCIFDHNRALGGSGIRGVSGDFLTGAGEGGGIGNYGNLIASNLVIRDNQAVAGAGNQGDAFTGDGVGGGIMNSFSGLGSVSATISNCTIAHNQAIGGRGNAGPGGDGLGGGIVNLLGAALTVNGCALTANVAVGGNGDGGGPGGDGLGAGLYNDGNSAFGVTSLTVTASTITDNRARGGHGDHGGSDGRGIGGGVYLVAGGVACADTFTIIVHNHASTSNADLFGSFTC